MPDGLQEEAERLQQRTASDLVAENPDMFGTWPAAALNMSWEEYQEVAGVIPAHRTDSEQKDNATASTSGPQEGEHTICRVAKMSISCWCLEIVMLSIPSLRDERPMN